LIDLGRRLGFDEPEGKGELMAIGVDTRGEPYGLLIDSIGEVLKLGAATREPNPLNLEPALARVSAGINRSRGRIACCARYRPRA
jgi:purine-binding chemotaxis protein CheW